MTRIAYPDDELLDRAIRAKGIAAVARELGLPIPTLRSHAERQGLATRQDPRPLPADALSRLAQMVD